MRLVLGASVVGLTLAAVPVQAETLHGALAAAYKSNPNLDAERANLRATDEAVPQARSGYRPNVSASADAGSLKSRPNPGETTARNPRGYEINVQQNLFDGFRTTNGVKQSEANVRAGRASLHAVEQSVLLDAATAYMNVVRDQAIVRLRDNNVRVLTKNLRATQDRFSAGEVTRTDVAQSRARRAGAISALDLARANLKSSRANFERVVGHPPSRLTNGRVPERLLPRALAEARRRATSETPSVISALYLEQAARHNVEVIWGELLPSVSLRANYTKRYDPSEALNSLGTASIVGQMNIPIYAQGAVRSRIRQAKHLHVRRLQLVADARKQARETVVTAWAALQAARAQLRSDQSQVDANRIALSGVREEEKVGQRTLLDVLDAEQELLDSQVSLVSTKRDLVVNAYALLSTTGRLTARELDLTKTVYDPERHYFDVRRKWYGISITHQNGHKERLDLWHSHGQKKSYK